MKNKQQGIKILDYIDLILTVSGLFLICFGVFQVYSPLGYIITGCILAFPTHLLKNANSKKVD